MLLARACTHIENTFYKTNKLRNWNCNNEIQVCMCHQVYSVYMIQYVVGEEGLWYACFVYVWHWIHLPPYFTSFEKKVVHLKQQGNRSLGFTIRGGEHIVQFEFDLMHECHEWVWTNVCVHNWLFVIRVVHSDHFPQSPFKNGSAFGLFQ